MGTVYSVSDPRLARRVAVKMHQPPKDEDQKAFQRFVREAQTTGRLEHPCIPPVYEYGETSQGQPYFALKWLEGKTLAEVIDGLRQGDEELHKKLDFATRYQIAIKLCEALGYAHGQGVLHRDLKPENVMLGQYGETWLVDWGVAGPPSEASQEKTDRLTEGPSFMGTLAYAAPEQVAGCYSPLSDQYSLGALLYELFTLAPAHPGETRMEVLTAVTANPVKPAESLKHPKQGRVPREVSVILGKMLAKKPEDRYSNLGEVTQAFKRVVAGDFPAICPHTATKRALLRFGKFLDNHNYWFMPLLMLWLAYPLYAAVSWLITKI